jgi:hypothetical protein
VKGTFMNVDGYSGSIFDDGLLLHTPRPEVKQYRSGHDRGDAFWGDMD